MFFVTFLIRGLLNRVKLCSNQAKISQRARVFEHCVNRSPILTLIFTVNLKFWKLGNVTRIFPSFSWGIFSHVTRLDQWRASENI